MRGSKRLEFWYGVAQSVTSQEFVSEFQVFFYIFLVFFITDM